MKTLAQTATRMDDPLGWADSANSVVVVGDENTVEFRPICNPPTRFFRLIELGGPQRRRAEVQLYAKLKSQRADCSPREIQT
jgi:hypothetical protein